MKLLKARMQHRLVDRVGIEAGEQIVCFAVGPGLQLDARGADEGKEALELCPGCTRSTRLLNVTPSAVIVSGRLWPR